MISRNFAMVNCVVYQTAGAFKLMLLFLLLMSSLADDSNNAGSGREDVHDRAIRRVRKDRSGQAQRRKRLGKSKDVARRRVEKGKRALEVHHVEPVEIVVTSFSQLEEAEREEENHAGDVQYETLNSVEGGAEIGEISTATDNEENVNSGFESESYTETVRNEDHGQNEDENGKENPHEGENEGQNDGEEEANLQSENKKDDEGGANEAEPLREQIDNVPVEDVQNDRNVSNNDHAENDAENDASLDNAADGDGDQAGNDNEVKTDNPVDTEDLETDNQAESQNHVDNENENESEIDNQVEKDSERENEVEKENENDTEAANENENDNEVEKENESENENQAENENEHNNEIGHENRGDNESSVRNENQADVPNSEGSDVTQLVHQFENDNQVENAGDVENDNQVADENDTQDKPVENEESPETSHPAETDALESDSKSKDPIIESHDFHHNALNPLIQDKTAPEIPHDSSLHPLTDLSLNEQPSTTPPTHENSSVNSDNCSGPNTKLTKNGHCVCSKGFHGDTPITKRGCWKCKTRCNVDATCAFPGECVCNDGLVGDGVTFCRIPKPVMKSVSPSEAEPTSVVTISYSVPTQYKPHTGYCMFGSSITAASIVDEHILTCEVPVDCHGIQPLRISLDSLRWSDEQFNFKIIRNTSLVMDLPWPIIGFVAFCVLIIALFGFGGRQQEEVPVDNPLVGNYSKGRSGIHSSGKRSEQARKRVVTPA